MENKFEGNRPVQTKYFASQEERNHFVLKNTGWKKRGKICTENLEKHLERETGADEK